MPGGHPTHSDMEQVQLTMVSNTIVQTNADDVSSTTADKVNGHFASGLHNSFMELTPSWLSDSSFKLNTEVSLILSVGVVDKPASAPTTLFKEPPRL